MIITQFIHQLNLTEIGYGSMNDTYVNVEKKITISNFAKFDEDLDLINIDNGKKLDNEQNRIQFTHARNNDQTRIKGLGTFFRERSAKPGDRFILEKRCIGEISDYFIGLQNRDTIMLMRSTGKCDGWIIQKTKPTTVFGIKKSFDNFFYEGKKSKIEIVFIDSNKKKENSPGETEFFDVFVDGESIKDEFKYQQYIEIDLLNEKLQKVKRSLVHKYVIKTKK